MRALLFVLSLLTLAAMSAQAADLPSVKRALTSGSVENLPSLTMTGEAEESVKPDYAILSLNASDERPTAMAAAADNAREMQALLARLQKSGVSAADIQTGDLVVTPQYKERRLAKSEEVERVLVGYRASTAVRVQLQDLEAAPRLARQIVESDARLYSGLSFEIRDNQERLAALRDKALQAAVANAHHFAKVASVQLGDLLRVAPLSSGSRVGAETERSDPEGFAVPARAAEIRVRAAVTVTWELKSQAAECADDRPK